MLAVWLHVICIRMPHLAFRTRKHLRVSSSFWMSWHQGPNFQIGWRLTQSMFVWSWPPTPLKSQRYRRQHWSSMASNDLRNRFFFLVYGKIVWSKLATYNLLIWFKWLTCLHHNIICLCLLFNWLNSCRKKNIWFIVPSIHLRIKAYPLAFSLLSLPIGLRVVKDAKQLIEERKEKIGEAAVLQEAVDTLQGLHLGDTHALLVMCPVWNWVRLFQYNFITRQ